MPVYLLDKNIWFPPPEEYEDHGIVALGGDVSPERLLSAYQSGIFPWYSEGEPITWFCPKKRMVTEPENLHLSKSTRNVLNRNIFTVKFNSAFEEVINACQHIKRPGQEGTWLNDDLKESIIQLHRSGHAHSVECFLNDQLVGGLYGISAGRVFCGDSMFSKAPNASKIALVYLAGRLKEMNYALIDGQVYNPHLAQFGFREISRNSFLQILKEARS